MLSDYANTLIARKTKGVVNGANEATFASSNIYGRLQQKLSLVRNVQGELVQSQSLIFTKTAVAVGDRLTLGTRDFTVIAVEPQPDLDGTVLWYEVYV